jgi:chromosome segregation ATPase
VQCSKTRLLANNKSLAMLLNKKKMEIKGLREANRLLNLTLGQYKMACRSLQQKLNTTNTTLRNLQNLSPAIFRDISNLLNRFENMRNVIAAMDVENIENQSLLNNISLAEQNSSKGKSTCRKRRGTLIFNQLI